MAIKIAKDKLKHFYVGIPLGAALEIVALWHFPEYPVLASFLSFFVLCAGCYGFELFSLVTGMGCAENMDAIAGILGGLIGIGAYALFHFM